MGRKPTVSARATRARQASAGSAATISAKLKLGCMTKLIVRELIWTVNQIMPRPSNTALRQDQIKDALLSVMAERGFDAATVAHIAQAAGLAPGLVHYHFASKQQILLALVRDL